VNEQLQKLRKSAHLPVNEILFKMFISYQDYFVKAGEIKRTYKDTQHSSVSHLILGLSSEALDSVSPHLL